MQQATNRDLEHLRLLSVFHYVVAGIVAVFGCMPMLHVAVGIVFITDIIPFEGDPPPDFFGWIFLVMGLFMVVLMWSLAIALYFAGRNLAQHKRYTYCFVVAGFACALMPFGTILGVFTIIVLMRESVRQLFGVDRGRRETATDDV